MNKLSVHVNLIHHEHFKLGLRVFLPSSSWDKVGWHAVLQELFVTPTMMSILRGVDIQIYGCGKQVFTETTCKLSQCKILLLRSTSYFLQVNWICFSTSLTCISTESGCNLTTLTCISTGVACIATTILVFRQRTICNCRGPNKIYQLTLHFILWSLDLFICVSFLLHR